MRDTSVPVVIVGGGPCGLFLGCLLAERGIEFVILEMRRKRPVHSRAIGIHPPSLEALEPVGVLDDLLERGVRIDGGVVHRGRRATGSMSFGRCPPPHNFVLSLPQTETERILEARLEEQAPGALRRGVRVDSLHIRPDGADIGFSAAEEQGDVEAGTAESGTPSESGTFRARWVVGCDGKDSLVRQTARIAFDGAPLPDQYLMGDFQDGTVLASRAGIWLTAEGLVESFPLPGGKRRWVVRLPETGAAWKEEPPSFRLATLLQRRTGHRPDPASCSMTSAFGIEQYVARTMARDQLLLAGDAAHVVSPIGGQGMNLGWLDAVNATSVINGECDAVTYTLRRRSSARKAARRAGFNTWMGRPRGYAWKAHAAALALKTPLSDIFAQRFTMRDL